jgi:hypothetical protein
MVSETLKICPAVQKKFRAMRASRNQVGCAEQHFSEALKTKERITHVKVTLRYQIFFV